jgi:hypothetical protein
VWNIGSDAIVVEAANTVVNVPFELRWVQRQDISGKPDVSLTASLTDSTAGTPVTNQVTLGPKGVGVVAGALPAWGLRYASTTPSNGYLIYNMSCPNSAATVTCSWS